MKLVGSTVWRYRNPCSEAAWPSPGSGSGREERWSLSVTLHLLCGISCAGGGLLRTSSGELGPELWAGAGLLGMGTCRRMWVLNCIQTFAALGTQKCYMFNEHAYKQTSSEHLWDHTSRKLRPKLNDFSLYFFFYPFLKAILISYFYCACEKNVRKENLRRKYMLCVRNNSKNGSPRSVPF